MLLYMLEINETPDKEKEVYNINFRDDEKPRSGDIAVFEDYMHGFGAVYMPRVRVYTEAGNLIWRDIIKNHEPFAKMSEAITAAKRFETED